MAIPPNVASTSGVAALAVGICPTFTPDPHSPPLRTPRAPRCGRGDALSWENAVRDMPVILVKEKSPHPISPV
ncbi:hypothetical protein GCM10027169_09980 [Gordonia jinhuaensis]|uniref:Uncharacterized protein n=1 Tax=Gordonia jinhuaensis TaxID=1517702 RepID=A0A916SWH4_9ACTN|nr:hypothetical protein [Gordonia jinhuaensis]GGB19204.1 hypothetical protein GCM10011489_04140 [Gordonia jinhuaensis]